MTIEPTGAGTEPEPDVITVGMLARLRPAFEAWLNAQGFKLEPLPEGEPDQLIVVPAPEPPPVWMAPEGGGSDG